QRGGGHRPCARPMAPTPTPPLKGRGLYKGSCMAARFVRPFAAHRADLAALAAADRRRALAPRTGIDFASNDYLGLAGSAALRDALADGIARGLPAGSGGSRLLRGNHPEHEALDTDAARHYRSEAAL